MFAEIKPHKMNSNFNIEMTYENFFEEVWDYVSEHIVTDDMWEEHKEKFQELSYDLYQFYKGSTLNMPNGEVQYLVSSKVYARIIESFVKNFSKELS